MRAAVVGSMLMKNREWIGSGKNPFLLPVTLITMALP
jgi:hypothetical protein